MNLPIVEQVKIQAQVLIPLVKALQAQLGEEPANAIVRKALGGLYRGYCEKWWQSQGIGDLGETLTSAFDRFAAADAMAYQVIRKTVSSRVVRSFARVADGLRTC